MASLRRVRRRPYLHVPPDIQVDGRSPGDVCLCSWFACAGTHCTLECTPAVGCGCHTSHISALCFSEFSGSPDDMPRHVHASSRSLLVDSTMAPAVASRPPTWLHPHNSGTTTRSSTRSLTSHERMLCQLRPDLRFELESVFPSYPACVCRSAPGLHPPAVLELVHLWSSSSP